jgi:hypothetical protein
VDAFSGMVGNLVTLFVVGAVLVVGIPILVRVAGRSASEWLSRKAGGGASGPGVDAPVERYPYRPRDGLFTPTEARFLQALDAAVGGSHRVFGKVRLADIVDVDSSVGRAAWHSAFNRISSKHVDFVVCDGDTLRLVAAIELDDASHDAPRRQRRDHFLERALAAAGVSLVRVPVAREYDVPALRRRVVGFGAEEGARAPAVRESTAEEREPRCPSCGSAMVRHTALRGTARQEYFVCEHAPTCRGRVSAR